jgi:hypothetical protein
MRYVVNNRAIEYHADGELFVGGNEVLLECADDLTVSQPWHQKGFTVQKLFHDSEAETFQAKCDELIRTLWRKSGLNIPDNISLDQYHMLVPDWNQHLAAVEHTKLVHVTDFPMGIKKIQERISEICGQKLIAKNPYDGQSVFHFRVIRPSSGDNNPLHRDVWLEDYTSCINLYIPIAGSSELTSLILIPGSHLWPESSVQRTLTGALINGVKFNVPAVTEILRPYEAIRPDPKNNEVLVFSPYLIHGGAVNLSPDSTRISIELRLWKDYAS